jgi:hypothetical protein
MSQSIELLQLTKTASGAVGASRLVGFNGAQATVAGQRVMGPALYAAANAEQFPVAVAGTAIVESGGVIAVGDALRTDNAGRAVAASALAAAVAIDDTKIAETVTLDDTKLTIDAGAVPVTSSAANGAVITAAAGAVGVAIATEAGVATATLTGSTLPAYVFGTALQAASGAGQFIEVLLGR